MLEKIKYFAMRMRNPDEIKQIVVDPKNRNPDPLKTAKGKNYWSDLSISAGYPGVLLLLSELDRLFPQDKWDSASHVYVLKIKESIEQGKSAHSLSLYGGLAGVCFALQQASRNETRYQKLLTTLTTYLINRARKEIFAPLRSNIENGCPSNPSHYELIQGVAGIGICGLIKLSNPILFTFVEEVIQLLIGITKPIKIEGKWVPGWIVSSHFQFLEEKRRHYPNGTFNLGLSHGITGVLAFLSVAILRGVNVEGQKEAIETIALWLQERRRICNGLSFWETLIPFEDVDKVTEDASFTGRDAWCYGTPGVSRSLYLAGKALKNKKMEHFSIQSFQSIFGRTPQQWHLPGPTICHGIAGLLLITSQMAKDTQDAELVKQEKSLKNKLLEYLNPEYPFGFRDYEPTHSGGYVEIDKVSLLEGAPGVLLTLLSLENETTWWHAPFLVGAGN